MCKIDGHTDTNQPSLRMRAESNSDSIMYIPVVKNADAFWCMQLVVVVWNGVQQLLGDQAGSEKE